MRAGGGRSAIFGERVDALVRELDRLMGDARGARGDTRAGIIERLHVLDEELIAAARAEADDEVTRTLSRDADEELAPFKLRMPQAEYARAHGAALDRLLRDAFGIPFLTYE